MMHRLIGLLFIHMDKPPGTRRKEISPSLRMTKDRARYENLRAQMIMSEAEITRRNAGVFATNLMANRRGR